MKVTIISNNNDKIVLKPETQAEILAIKAMHGKEIKTEYHEKAQILSESFPDCLVLSSKKEENIVQPVTQVVLIDLRNNRPIAVIPPGVATYQRMVDAVVTALNLDAGVNRSVSEKDNILIVQPSGTDEDEELSFEILKVPIL